MKLARFLAFFLLVAAAAAGALLYWNSQLVPVPTSPVPTPIAGVLAVGQLRTEPPQLESQLNVVGVVGQTDAEKELFGLIDETDAETCGAPCGGCASFLLPVSWDGKMPSVGDVLLVRGIIRKSKDRLVLVASALEEWPQ